MKMPSLPFLALNLLHSSKSKPHGAFLTFDQKLKGQKTQIQQKIIKNSWNFRPETQESGNFGATLGKKLSNSRINSQKLKEFSS